MYRSGRWGGSLPQLCSRKPQAYFIPSWGFNEPGLYIWADWDPDQGGVAIIVEKEWRVGAKWRDIMGGVFPIGFVDWTGFLNSGTSAFMDWGDTATARFGEYGVQVTAPLVYGESVMVQVFPWQPGMQDTSLASLAEQVLCPVMDELDPALAEIAQGLLASERACPN